MAVYEEVTVGNWGGNPDSFPSEFHNVYLDFTSPVTTEGLDTESFAVKETCTESDSYEHFGSKTTCVTFPPPLDDSTAGDNNVKCHYGRVGGYPECEPSYFEGALPSKCWDHEGVVFKPILSDIKFSTEWIELGQALGVATMETDGNGAVTGDWETGALAVRVRLARAKATFTRGDAQSTLTLINAVLLATVPAISSLRDIEQVNKSSARLMVVMAVAALLNFTMVLLWTQELEKAVCKSGLGPDGCVVPRTDDMQSGTIFGSLMCFTAFVEMIIDWRKCYQNSGHGGSLGFAWRLIKVLIGVALFGLTAGPLLLLASTSYIFTGGTRSAVGAGGTQSVYATLSSPGLTCVDGSRTQHLGAQCHSELQPFCLSFCALVSVLRIMRSTAIVAACHCSFCRRWIR